MNKIISLLKEKKYIFLAIIFLYSIFIKFYYLWFQSFWIDEGFSSYVSLELFEKWIFFIKWEYLLHNLSQILSFNIFWVSDFSARFFSVIFSLINSIFIYLISIKLFKNKKQAILSTLIFSFLTWEIIWSRQARFYSLLQLIFSINLYLNISIVKQYLKNNKKIIIKRSFLENNYLNIFIILAYIWILFHPFLYSNIVIFVVSIFYFLFVKITLLRKKMWPLAFKKNNILIKYISTIIILLIISLIEIIKYYSSLWNIWISSSSRLPEHFIKSYINNYNFHLFWELWILYFFFIISLFILAIKRKILELIFLWFSFFFIFYIISQKWFLFHTRYVLILYPLIIIWASYSIYYFFNLFKNKYLKYIYFIIIFIFILFTAKFTFLPQKEYSIDHTSPQPNFKEAYNIVPDNSKIISWFPMMCEWYYWKKWKCLYHLPVDYVWSQKSIKATLARWKDNYTKIPYLLDLNQLKNWKKYYFIMDALSLHRIINKDILKNILKNWKIIFDNWKLYNNIKVIQYTKLLNTKKWKQSY
jgi:hypothetical protein